jgi:hypothetical protein
MLFDLASRVPPTFQPETAKRRETTAFGSRITREIHRELFNATREREFYSASTWRSGIGDRPEKIPRAGGREQASWWQWAYRRKNNSKGGGINGHGNRRNARQFCPFAPFPRMAREFRHRKRTCWGATSGRNGEDANRFSRTAHTHERPVGREVFSILALANPERMGTTFRGPM